MLKRLGWGKTKFPIDQMEDIMEQHILSRELYEDNMGLREDVRFSYRKDWEDFILAQV